MAFAGWVFNASNSPARLLAHFVTLSLSAMHMAVAVNVNQGHPINIESITLCAIVWHVSCLQFSVPKCDPNEWLNKDPSNLSFFFFPYCFFSSSFFKSHIIWSLTICHDHNYHQSALLEFSCECADTDRFLRGLVRSSVS